MEKISQETTLPVLLNMNSMTQAGMRLYELLHQLMDLSIWHLIDSTMRAERGQGTAIGRSQSGRLCIDLEAEFFLLQYDTITRMQYGALILYLCGVESPPWIAIIRLQYGAFFLYLCGVESPHWIANDEASE